MSDETGVSELMTPEYYKMISMIDMLNELNESLASHLKSQFFKVMIEIGSEMIKNNKILIDDISNMELLIKTVEFDLICTTRERDDYKRQLDELSK